MVSASLRQNPPEPVGRNASATEASRAAIGLTERADGYYDRAGRRLFLADRSPDPMTPGAYRYQAHPDFCDFTALETDPASPRYEPPHLRHRPGDTWEIGGKPRDPDDPGPYGSAGWRPDTRTGRHRRDELPDPIAARARSQQDDDDSPEPAPQSVNSDRPPREPRRRSRFWPEEAEEPTNDEAPREEPYRFHKLQEDAWDRFVIKSAELAAAHQITALGLAAEYGRTAAWFLRVFEWIVAILKGPNVVARTADDESLVQAVDEEVPNGPGVQVAREACSRPGSRLAAAVTGAQTARAQLAGQWREQPRQSRSRPSPVPYMFRWEQAFDAERGFSEVVVL